MHKCVIFFPVHFGIYMCFLVFVTVRYSYAPVPNREANDLGLINADIQDSVQARQMYLFVCLI